MNNSKKLIANIAICLIVVALTLVVFFVGISEYERTNFHYAGLVFVLISEFALFTGLIFISTNHVNIRTALVRSGIITTLSGYWILTSLVSLFSKGIFNYNLGRFITVQIIIMGAVAIIIISLFVVSSSIQTANEKDMNRKHYLQEGENIVLSIKNDIKHQSYRQYLDELYEILKYSDKIAGDITLDKEINHEIMMLSYYLNGEEIKEIEVKQYVDKISSIIKERNAVTLQSKRGGY